MLAVLIRGCQLFKEVIVKALYCSLLSQSGETALHVAARYGNVDVVSYLCSIKANPDLADRVSHARVDTHLFLF